MANQKFTIRKYNGTVWDELYPKTTADQVVTDAGNRFVTDAEKAVWNGKQEALGYTPENFAKKGAANGYAGLDASGKVPAAQLPSPVLGALNYKGTMDASGGAYPASPSKGDYYVCSVAGVISTVDYQIGDWAVYNGTAWDKVDNSDKVSSVNGATGAVTLAAADVGAVPAADVVTTAAANKILRLNASSKLPASITGGADGNAATATKLATARTISLTGDATGSASFDGSANASVSVTLANSGVTVGTYTKLTVDAKGRVTAGAQATAGDIGAAKITVSASQPSSPVNGDFWYEVTG